ncbi:MbtH family NRPS accessory protein [Streptomyces sp. ML-6]|uniref:MbtH family protein n=1 Tax=unclassified Streptomyces TaxID=2593676 RepID=UPI0024BF1D4C|nr:MbtH family NRPS accessory protein [Streptomyces sp. ML-6]MDK0524158.1 MbtH family NRPS accessory protein [Streptomyces sp. ML-6]
MSTHNGTGDEGDGNETRYGVVINDEEQYSIWPAHREVPAGWRETGTQGTKQECLDHIDVVWTDMRPRSLREQMAAQEA